MDRNSDEYKRVREQIITILEDSEDTPPKDGFAYEILELKGIAIEADDQSLPKAKHQLLGGGGGTYTVIEICDANYRKVI